MRQPSKTVRLCGVGCPKDNPPGRLRARPAIASGEGHHVQGEASGVPFLEIDSRFESMMAADGSVLAHRSVPEPE